jgi:hypothetical protein
MTARHAIAVHSARGSFTTAVGEDREGAFYTDVDIRLDLPASFIVRESGELLINMSGQYVACSSAWSAVALPSWARPPAPPEAVAVKGRIAGEPEAVAFGPSVENQEAAPAPVAAVAV